MSTGTLGRTFADTRLFPARRRLVAVQAADSTLVAKADGFPEHT
jgi:hypothetical protein